MSPNSQHLFFLPLLFASLAELKCSHFVTTPGYPYVLVCFCISQILNPRLEPRRERLASLGCLIHADGPRKDLAAALPQDLPLEEVVVVVMWQEV